MTDVFGSWERFRVECESAPDAPAYLGARDAAGLRHAAKSPDADSIRLYGDPYVIDGLRARRAAAVLYSSDDWQFVAWAVATGQAFLPNVPTDSETNIEQLLREIAHQQGQVHVIFPDVCRR